MPSMLTAVTAVRSVTTVRSGSAVFVLAIGWAIGVGSAWVPTTLFDWIAGLVGPAGPSPWLGPPLALVVLAWGHERRWRLLVLAAAVAFGLGVWDRAASDWRQLSLPLPGFPREMHLIGTVVRPPEIDTDGERILTVRVRKQSRQQPIGPEWTVQLRVAAGTPPLPDEHAALRYGDSVRGWCRLRAPRAEDARLILNPVLRLRARGLDATGWVKSPRLLERGNRKASPGNPSPGHYGFSQRVGRNPLTRIARGLDTCRTHLRQKLDEWLDDDPASRAIAGAMLLGDRGCLSTDQQIQLRASGLAHLIAISGLHVGLIWGLVVTIARRWRWGLLCVTVASILALPAFGYLVGARPSVVRALLFTGWALAGGSLGRRPKALHLLLLAATLSVAGQPTTWASGGFQLSFAAVSGLILGAGNLAPRLPLPKWVAVPMSASIMTYLATAPLSASLFGQLAPVSLISNFLGVPLAACILAGGYFSLLGTAFGLDSPLPGFHLSIAALSSVASNAATWPTEPIWVSGPGWLCLGSILGLVVCWRLPAASWQRVRWIAAVGLVLHLHIGLPPPSERAAATLHLFDVGQGQAVWIHAGSRSILIDAGGSPWGGFDPGSQIVVPALLSRGFRRIDVLALSHGDADHAAGAEAVLRSIEVEELWLGPLAHHSSRVRRLRGIARERGVSVRLVGRQPGAETRGRISIAWFEVPKNLCDSGNDRSLVFQVSGRRSRSVLVPGDLEECGLRALLDSASGRLRSELLILAHHGSRSGTSDAWLDAVDPGHAWVSCGFHNRFDHPDIAVRQRLKRRGLLLQRTDREGDLSLQFNTNGSGMKLK